MRTFHEMMREGRQRLVPSRPPPQAGFRETKVICSRRTGGYSTATMQLPAGWFARYKLGQRPLSDGWWHAGKADDSCMDKVVVWKAAAPQRHRLGLDLSTRWREQARGLVNCKAVIHEPMWAEQGTSSVCVETGTVLPGEDMPRWPSGRVGSARIPTSDSQPNVTSRNSAEDWLVDGTRQAHAQAHGVCLSGEGSVRAGCWPEMGPIRGLCGTAGATAGRRAGGTRRWAS